MWPGLDSRLTHHLFAGWPRFQIDVATNPGAHVVVRAGLLRYGAVVKSIFEASSEALSRWIKKKRVDNILQIPMQFLCECSKMIVPSYAHRAHVCACACVCICVCACACAWHAHECARTPLASLYWFKGGTWVHSSVVRAADCRSAGPWFKSGCALRWLALSLPTASMAIA